MIGERESERERGMINLHLLLSPPVILAGECQMRFSRDSGTRLDLENCVLFALGVQLSLFQKPVGEIHFKEIPWIPEYKIPVFYQPSPVLVSSELP